MGIFMGVAGFLFALVFVCMFGWRRFVRATKKPPLRPLSAEYAHTVPVGAVDISAYPTYSMDTVDTTYHMLYMPGNAGMGAYSAGIACGLQRHHDFHTVVGISSGALATLFVYANDPPTLQRVLAHMDTHKAIRMKPLLLSLLFGYSFADNSPLQSYLSAFVTDDFIDMLQSRHRLGYRAYVISHNLDTAQSVFWDIGAIASLSIPYAQRRQKLIEAVVASTALPMIFNPIHIPIDIGGKPYTQTHVDGAVSAHTVFADWMVPQNITDFGDKMITIAQTNGYYDIAPAVPTDWKTVLIGTQALGNSYHGAYHASLKSTAVFADRHHMRVRINRITPDTILGGDNMDFSHRVLNRYFNAGVQEIGENKIVWDTLSTVHHRI